MPDRVDQQTLRATVSEAFDQEEHSRPWRRGDRTDINRMFITPQRERIERSSRHSAAVQFASHGHSDPPSRGDFDRDAVPGPSWSEYLRWRYLPEPSPLWSVTFPRARLRLDRSWVNLLTFTRTACVSISSDRGRPGSTRRARANLKPQERSAVPAPSGSLREVGARF